MFGVLSDDVHPGPKPADRDATMAKTTPKATRTFRRTDPRERRLRLRAR